MSQPEPHALIEVVQSYYQGCGHAFLEPHPPVGQHYRITAFLDSGGDCPLCIQEKRDARKAMKGIKDV